VLSLKTESFEQNWLWGEGVRNALARVSHSSVGRTKSIGFPNLAPQTSAAGTATDCSPASLQLLPPVTRWWKSTSGEAWARTTRSPSQHPTQCPSQAPWMTTSPKLSVTRGFRSKQPRMARPAALSRPRAGASRPALLLTWSATATPPPWSPEGGAVF
jgi:hypothetical protein